MCSKLSKSSSTSQKLYYYLLINYIIYKISNKVLPRSRSSKIVFQCKAQSASKFNETNVEISSTFTKYPQKFGFSQNTGNAQGFSLFCCF